MRHRVLPLLISALTTYSLDIGMLTSVASAATPDGRDGEHLRAQCAPLTVENADAGFVIEKAPCESGGLAVPRQLVVPTVSPIRGPVLARASQTDAGESARWNVGARDFSVLEPQQLVKKAEVATRVTDLEAASAAGDADAAVLLGVARLFGLGVPKDEVSGAQLLRKAAEAGHPRAFGGWGGILMKGLAGVAADPVTGRDWARRGAEAGNAVAMFNFAEGLDRGLGGPKDPVASAQWLRRAADLGFAPAMYYLGMQLYEGRPPSSTNSAEVAKNPGEAAIWYRRAAEKGVAGAMNNLGLMLYDGDGVPKDEAEGEKWLRAGAAGGDANAQRNLDDRLRRKQGKPPAPPGSGGVLTEETMASPYNLAERAAYCYSAIRTVTGLLGTRKATPEEEQAKNTWKDVQREAMIWSSLYGRLSLFGLNHQQVGVAIDGKLHVSDTVLTACNADLQIARANLGRLSTEVYAKGWEAANRQNRAQRSVMKPGAGMETALYGWCTGVVAEARTKLRVRPTLFGYDPNIAEGAAAIARIDARLDSAGQFFQQKAKQFTAPRDTDDIAIGREDVFFTRNELLRSKASPDTKDLVVRHWLATEADLCTRIAMPDAKEVTMPPVAGGPMAIPKTRPQGPYRYAWSAAYCRNAELQRANGAETGQSRAWTPLLHSALRWAVLHGQSLRQIDPETGQAKPAPSTDVTCEQDLRAFTAQRADLERTWAAQQVPATKAAANPSLATHPLAVAWESGWCQVAVGSVIKALETSPEQLGFDATTPAGRDQIARGIAAQKTHLIPWSSRHLELKPSADVSDKQLLASLNAGMAAYRRYRELASVGVFSLADFMLNETRACNSDQINLP